MKVLAVILGAFAFIAAMVALGFVAAMKFGPPTPSQKIQVMYGQPVEGEQRQGLHTNEFIHQVWDSGLVPHGMIASTDIYWLDDSTLLFMADKDPKPPRGDKIRIPWLFLWRLGEQPRPVGEGPYEATRFYRAARGQVCYWQKKIDPATGHATEVLMKGPPGEEREGPRWPVGPKGLPLSAGHIETVDCEQFTDPAMAGRVYSTDSYHRYYLDRTAYPQGLPPASGENPILMKSDGSGRVVLPIPPHEVGNIYFRTFDDVFWTLEDTIGAGPRVQGGPIIDGFLKWKETNCLALWRIDPSSGSTERRCIPFGPWSGHMVDASRHSSALLRLIPSAKGLFLETCNYLDSVSESHVGPSGLYQLGAGVPRRVLAGYVQSSSVSPNGCRVAFIYGPNIRTQQYGTAGSWTIAAIDLCG